MEVTRLWMQKISRARHKYNKARKQMQILNRQLDHLETRYKRSLVTKCHARHYSLRQKLSIIAGVHMMFQKYADTKSEEIAQLLRQATNFRSADFTWPRIGVNRHYSNRVGYLSDEDELLFLVPNAVLVLPSSSSSQSYNNAITNSAPRNHQPTSTSNSVDSAESDNSVTENGQNTGASFQ
ncbi:uncharacterized protein LOC141908111 [Tubulanus polymorphus]|uniref:uncharacterized protein LOC141908111 n=1 Tax=Tubulanus polymorphus TaxID=672921 RepID=UPI003DA58CA5